MRKLVQRLIKIKTTLGYDPIDVHLISYMAYLILQFIALKSKNEIISGLIFDPIKNEMFYAEKNNGAYFNNHRIRAKKNKIDECLFVTGGKIKQIDLQYRKSGSAASI